MFGSINIFRDLLLEALHAVRLITCNRYQHFFFHKFCFSSHSYTKETHERGYSLPSTYTSKEPLAVVFWGHVTQYESLPHH